MGKGDKKTRRGKLFNRSYGKLRPRKSRRGTVPAGKSAENQLQKSTRLKPEMEKAKSEEEAKQTPPVKEEAPAGSAGDTEKLEKKADKEKKVQVETDEVAVKPEKTEPPKKELEVKEPSSEKPVSKEKKSEDTPAGEKPLKDKTDNEKTEAVKEAEAKKGDREAEEDEEEQKKK